MDPTGNSESVAISSVHERDVECSEHTCNDTQSEETYCDDLLNVSGNSCDCAGYFEMPECVMDIYLLALDGGDDSNAALRQISDVWGPKDDDKEVDSNCNHNINPEPYPNEGCGCTGSYNGGAGGGTAYCGNDPCGPYERGFKDKKRDTICCGCQDDTYQEGLVNKKPDFTDNYISVFQGASSPKGSCCQQSVIHPKNTYSGYEDDTYQQPLANKKPESPDVYVPMIPTNESFGLSSGCASCNGYTDSFEIVRNTDTFLYTGGSPDRTNFYADDSCECHKLDTSCNNNLKLFNSAINQNCEHVRKPANSIFPTESSYSFLKDKGCESGLKWMCDLSQTTAVYNSDICHQVYDSCIESDLIPNDCLALDAAYNAIL